jgi:hypothetical protein
MVGGHRRSCARCKNLVTLAVLAPWWRFLSAHWRDSFGQRAVRIAMGLFRYILEGFGWEIGATAAREGIGAAKKAAKAANEAEARRALPPTKRELRRLEKATRNAEAERKKAVERKKAELEAELARLKKQT